MKKLMILLLVSALSAATVYAQDSEPATTNDDTSTVNPGRKKSAEVNKGQKGEQMREQNRQKREAKKAEMKAKREAKKAEREAKKQNKKNRPE